MSPKSSSEEPGRPRAEPPRRHFVVVIHGLWKTSVSMRRMARALKESGFLPLNRSYPTGWQSVMKLASTVDRFARAKGCYQSDADLSLVTHSCGGLIARAYATAFRPPNLRRIVTIAPPNQGAILADMVRPHPFRGILLKHGVGREIGVGAEAVYRKLPEEIPAEVGIIAGGLGTSEGFLPLLNEDNDGRVTVASTKLPCAEDFIVLPCRHTSMPAVPEVIAQAIAFLKEGRFSRSSP